MGDRLTKEQEDALRTAEKAATDAPWETSVTNTIWAGSCNAIASAYRDQDREFIVLARNAMPALLTELDALRAEKARLRAACERAAESFDRLEDDVDYGFVMDEAEALRVTLKETQS